MNISKALKVKNRLIGKISSLMEIIKRENSRRNDNPSTVNVEDLFVELSKTREKLVNLKAAIVMASAPIARSLASLSEIKDHINWMRSLPTREGQEIIHIGASQSIGYNWSSFVNREKLDLLLKSHQDEIDKLQDEVDEFNAKTQVNIDI